MMIGDLVDPPQGSYVPWDLVTAAVCFYWPSLLVAPLLALLPTVGSRHHRKAPPLVATIPLLAWALQSHLDLQDAWSLPAYFLWHRLFLSILALAGVLGILAVVLRARCARGVPPRWPNPVWCGAVIATPLVDWLFLIFVSSPIEAVFHS